MNTCSFPRSNLDVSAAEFVPFEKLQQKDSKHASIQQLKGIIEPVFQGNSSFSDHILQIKQIALAKNVNASRLIGEVLGDLITVTPERSSVGFRFVKKLLTVLPVPDGQELQAGLIASVDEFTNSLISDTSVNNLFTQFIRSSTQEQSSVVCEGDGDQPDELTDKSTDRVFGVLRLLNLLITRLNMADTPDECLCIPPTQPCIDLCLLVDTACRLQLTYANSNLAMISESPSLAVDLFTQKDWLALLYQLFDTFSQSLPFFNCLLTNLNSRTLNGSWNNAGSLEERANTSSGKSVAIEDEFEHGAYLSSLLSNVLTCMRELLLAVQLPLKLLRSTVLDVLLCANQLATLSTSYEAALEPSLHESDDDEVNECYRQFLEQTNQIPKR
ncbi:hypothetical protein EG68_06085 [Paragonimus skrjabini miyazakii]|uniref:Uncharacterized protein n=1 Tax=Paragonimus skrjabini miyazakii TaxID=59628 RepID=A0A8S9YP10_9TREM|nr:hypothetical protein EG68_06085 [Paragonimus skrjabini miyazakii]